VQSVDFLIIGQGLAGSCLALEFLKRGISFLVIDQQWPNSASRVAAGLFNPITGKTMEATWRANEIFSFLSDFYKGAQDSTQRKFLHTLAIYRPFLSVEESSKWQQSPNAFVTRAHTQSQYPNFINDDFGGLELNHSGFLDTNAFLSAVRRLLEQKNCVLEEDFTFDALDADSGVYKNYQPRQIIFCDGTAANQNPLFRWLPIRKLKGETLQIEIDLPQNIIFNRGVFAVPMVNQNNFLVGSTYSHDAQPGNTEAGIAELTKKARILFKNDFTVLSKNWGHRPTSPDRRPILGAHPAHKKLHIFNGLGTKGVSLAPFFAVQLADHIEGKRDLEPAVNIERFYSLYFQFREKDTA
jgi:glycine oxidase